MDNFHQEKLWKTDFALAEKYPSYTPVGEALRA